MIQGKRIMHNQRGGILSRLFFIPIGVAFMVGFFLLGYYVGKYQSKSGVTSEVLPPLPDVASDYIPKKEDFTFYKTLTEKGGKMVSLNLKPKPRKPAAPAKKKNPERKPRREPAKKEKQLDITIEKSSAQVANKTAPKTPDTRKEKKAEPQSPQNGEQRFTIQISSYPERGMAEEEVSKMKKRGYAAFIVASEIPDKGTWYRVRVGSFRNKSSAARLMNKLRSREGLSPYITAE